MVAGTVIGTALTAPLALVSLRTGTNLSTSSGAQFGVRGRLVGSVVGLLLSLGYTALTIRIGGDVTVGAPHRLLGLPTGGLSYALVYALLAAATVTGAVHGYRVPLRLSRVLALGMTALLILGVVAYALGGDHPDRLRALPRGVRRGGPPGLQPPLQGRYLLVPRGVARQGHGVLDARRGRQPARGLPPSGADDHAAGRVRRSRSLIRT